MRIATIFARAGTEAFPFAEAEADALFAARLPGVEREVVVVDNLLAPGVHESSGARTVIGGDNSAWEFSAFDAGLRHLGDRLATFQWVNLVTSAFNTLYTDYLQRFDAAVLDAARGRGVALGHIDYYNRPIRLCGYPSQHWTRTSFVMIPPAELQILGTLVSVRDRARFFTGDPGQPFRDDAPISGAMRQYITDWLTGHDIGQGTVWHRRLALDETTLPSFEAKTLAILNEHLLGIRLRTQGTVTADVSWAAGELGRLGQVPWGTPWRQQMVACGRIVPAWPAEA